MISFRVDGRSVVPPYLQIVQQVRQALRMGVLDVGDQLPTVREVVSATAINPNTVLKAYRDLEREGLIVTQQGKGSIVAPDPKLGAKLYDQELAKHLERVAQLGELLGLRPEELAARVREAADRLTKEYS